ncbi:MAG: ribonuclease III [Nitrospirota bacterium]
MARPSVHDAQRAIGYQFRQPQLLDEALTHKSHVNETKSKERRHNERLEFLGDAVLSLIVSDHLAVTCPDAPEGELSKLKARLVSEAALAAVARDLRLGALLRLGRGEELTQGREKNSLLANALEALIAAVYLDGGLEAARTFTLQAFAPALGQVRAGQGDLVGDYKTQLQEWCQKRFEALPQYVIVRESGPDHQKTFEVQVAVQGDVVGVGIGRTKKEAEQMAAKQALAEAAKREP